MTRVGTCTGCGGSFAVGIRGRIARFCSDRCRSHAKWRRAIAARPPATCRHCGSTFPAGHGRKYCSKRCTAVANYAVQQARKHAALLRQLVCPQCGVEFETAESLKRYCSTRCRRAVSSLARHQRVGRSVSPGAFEIAERDGWICHLCGEAIEPGLSWPHPKSRTLDHLVPVSLGGEHSRENVAIAHLGCNSRRSNKPLAIAA